MGRRFRPGETPPENLLNEVRLFHSLAMKTVDLIRLGGVHAQLLRALLAQNMCHDGTGEEECGSVVPQMKTCNL